MALGSTGSVPLIRFLDTNGDGTGVKNAIGNYAVTAEEFFIQPPAGVVYVITEFLIHLADAANFSVTGFGSRTALTNGIIMQTKRGAMVVLDLNDGIIPLTNPQLLHLSHRAQILDFPGGGNSMTISFSVLDFQVPLILDGAMDDALVVTLHDDFSTQDDFHFIVHGYY